MASQISHIVYAKKYFEKHPMKEMDREFFILGCVFPDIRRVDMRIKRGETHLRFSPIDLNFEGLNAFEAGWKFHLYCDMKREEILRDYNFYSLKGSKSEKWLHPAKLVEDEILYDEYNNWEKVAALFNNPPRIKLDIQVSKESFDLWYAMTARYLEKKPDEKSMHIFLLKQRGLPGRVDEIIKTVSMIRENKKAVEILSRIIEEII